MVQPESDLLGFYLEAHDEVVGAGFEEELAWLDVGPRDVSETEFLEETAWVILSSGFSHSVVAGRFPRLCSAFDGFVSVGAIVERRVEYERRALRVFGHQGKIAAICTAALLVRDIGVSTLVERARDDLLTLTLIPYVGPVTAKHLARNLGVDVAKPDRHMVRLAARVGAGVSEMAEALAMATGDPVRVVDGVLWRHAVLRPDACGHVRGSRP